MNDSKEYIEREALMQELEEIGGCDAPPDSWADGFDKGILSAIKHVEAQPAADVVEVRHGKWNKKEYLYTTIFDTRKYRRIDIERIEVIQDDR